MKKLSILLIATIVSCMAIGQTGEQEIANRINHVFAKWDKSSVPTGVLGNYGVQTVDLEYYQGVAADSNYVDLKNFMLLYSGIYTSKINGKITLQTPDAVVGKIKGASNTVAIPLAVMHYQYNMLKENSVDLGLVKVENDQIVRAKQNISPYETKDLFAIAPQKVKYKGANVAFVFKKELLFSNVGKTVKNYQVRFNNDLGYITTGWGIKVSHTYGSSGVKHLRFRVNYTDGTSMESQTNIFVKVPEPKTRSVSATDSVEIYKNNKHSGGTLQIKLATGNTSGKIRKALIIAEGFDPMQIMKNENVDIDDFLLSSYNIYVGTINNPNFSPNLYTELENQDYDIVYLDYNDGIDDIRRNAALLQEAITWVNNNKVGSQPNVVMGISMGGLVARYALRKMELANIDHQTWKYISIDSPHKGANVPVGLQAMVRKFISKDLEILNSIKLKSTLFSEDLKNAAIVLNSMATKQMLIYRVTENGYDNSIHNSFMKEYESLGFPQKCQNVAISNGRNDGKKIFDAGSTLIDSDISLTHLFIDNPISQVLSVFSLLTNYPQVALNIIPGPSAVRFRIFISSVNADASNRVYYGKIYFVKRILGLITIKVRMMKDSFYAQKGMLPIDGVQGGTSYLTNFSIDILSKNGFKQRKFCFIPTASALALNNWENNLNTNLSGIDLFAEDKTNFEYIYNPPYNEVHTTFYHNTNFLREHIKTPPIYIKKMEESFCGTQSIEVNNPLHKTLNWSISYSNFKINSSNNYKASVTSPPFVKGAIVTVSSGETYPLRKRLLSTCKLSITGPDLICDQASYTINNLPANTPVQWSTNNSKLTLVSGQGTATAVFHKNGNGECTVKASIANGLLSFDRKVWSGNFILSYGVDRSDCLTSIDTYKTPLINSVRYIWKKNGIVVQEGIGENIYSYTYSRYIHTSFETYNLEVTVEKNGCVLSPYKTICSYYYRPAYDACSRDSLEIPKELHRVLTPNNDGLNDELCLSSLSVAREVSELSRVVVYNALGELIYEGYSKNFDENSFEGVGNVGSYAGVVLPEGVYFYKTMGRCTTSGSIYLRR